MIRITFVLSIVVLCMATMAAAAELLAKPQAASTVVTCATDASEQEMLAAREIRRYVYLRTGALLSVKQNTTLPENVHAIHVATKDRAIIGMLATDAGLKQAIAALAPQQYLLRTITRQNRRVLLVVGGDSMGTLYGAYAFAEQLGVRFGLDEDVIPDQRLEWRMPILDELGKPRFAIRGLNSWGTYWQGLDWWNQADYEGLISQMVKLRLNFIGFHTYPCWNAVVGPEATVWIGLPEDVDQHGNVRFGYTAGVTTSQRMWANRNSSPRTSCLSAGAKYLFDREEYAADFIEEWPQWPKAQADCVKMFNRYGDLQKQAFAHARGLGVKTCVGTETPMGIPPELQKRLKAKGMDPNDPEVIRRLYEGTFLRLMRKAPTDYYWLWTPEVWMAGAGLKDWEITTKENTERDMKLADAAAKAVGAPFRLATCGWLLGASDDHLWCNQRVPKSWPAASLNLWCGRMPVDPEYGAISGRSKWAIHWSQEDYSNLPDVQLWVERLFADALDAKRYGCDGFMTLQWRTSAANPMASALCRATWDRSNKEPMDDDKMICCLGGRTVKNPQPIANTQDPAVYQTARHRFGGYRVRVPKGVYNVKLQFCEWQATGVVQRVFDITVQGKKVLASFDIFAAVGKNAALDKEFRDVDVQDGWLTVDLTPKIGETCLSGLVVESRDKVGASKGAEAMLLDTSVQAQTLAHAAVQNAPVRIKVNCGGPAHGDYRADPQPKRGRVKDMVAYWQEWGQAWFGPEGGADAGAALQKFDGKTIALFELIDKGKRSSNAEVEAAFAPLKELEQIRSRIVGAGNLARFDYWLNLHRAHYHRIYSFTHAYRLDDLMKQCRGIQDPQKKKAMIEKLCLPLRLRIARDWEGMMGALVACANTPGDVGAIASLGCIVVGSGYDGELTTILGKPLPPAASASTEYTGAPRIYVPGKRSHVHAKESQEIKAFVLSQSKSTSLVLHWRPLGVGDYRKVEGQHVDRQAYRVCLPPIAEDAVEYYLEAILEDGHRVLWPATAPTINHTAVLSRSNCPVMAGANVETSIAVQ